MTAGALCIVPISPNNDTLARLSCCVVTSQCFELLSTGPSNRDHIHNRSGKKKIANKEILYNITFTINQKLEHIVKTFSLSLKRHLNPLVGYQRGTVIDTTPAIVIFQSGVQLNSKEINSFIFSESILNDLVSEQSPHISIVDKQIFSLSCGR